MTHFQTERRAIHRTALIFNDYGWSFVEQPIGDIGIDAMVELPIDANQQVKILGLQIKGGKSNFHRTKNYLTFYFSERHYIYWEAKSKHHPVLIILYDPVTDLIYWQQFRNDHITKTSKHWKLNVPLNNVLNQEAKASIEALLSHKTDDVYSGKVKDTILPQKEKQQELKFSYSINKQKKGSLFMTIQSSSESFSFSLCYKPKNIDWDQGNAKLNWEDPYYYSLLNFEQYLLRSYKILYLDNKGKPLSRLVNTIQQYIDDGIEKIAAFIFDHQNEASGIPKYNEFCHAFERYSGLTKNQYKTQAIDYILNFYTNNGDCFEMNTYEGKTALLKDFINRRSYDEIYTETDENIWSEIYMDIGIEKSKFVPIMFRKWEAYWADLYHEVAKEGENTNHLYEMKEASLQQLNLFFDNYNETGDIIVLAYDFDESVMYPLAVLTMVTIFGADICYEKYCELEFFTNGEWESIRSDNESETTHMFFIKPSDL